MPLAGSIAPFVVSSPFRGLRVVPCKLYFVMDKASGELKTEVDFLFPKLKKAVIIILF